MSSNGKRECGAWLRLLSSQEIIVAVVILIASSHIAHAQASEEDTMASSRSSAAATVSSTASSTRVTAVRTLNPPKIDGKDDDPAWRAAPVISNFRMFAPRDNALPTFRTEARILYDDHALYVLVRAYDPHPDSIVRRLARRDTDGPPNDQVLLFIDSFHDRRSGYEYIVNPAGVKSDYLISDDTNEDPSWDGIWDVATGVDSLGWVAEFAIPLQQLRFVDRRAPVFGLMIGRWIGRTDERSSWPQYRRSKAGLASQFGELAGLHDLEHPASVEVTPYAMARTRNIAQAPVSPGRMETRPAIGADIKWLPRPNVSVDATINPDFGQVDADPAVLNLSGVELFQADRRPFFLEGSGLLNLPLTADGSAQLFYSRRIGRRPALFDLYAAPDSPTETPIIGAARVTARLTPTTSLAVLSGVTQAEDGGFRPGSDTRFVIEPHATYGVARLQRDFREGRSGIGFMLTRVGRDVSDPVVSTILPSTAQALAITTQHQTADGTYQVSAWGALSDVHGSAPAIARLQLSPVHEFQRPGDDVSFDSSRTALRGSAAYLSMGKVGGGITRFSTSYRRIAPGFDVNEMGFLTVSGIQTYTADAGLSLTRPGAVMGVPYRKATVSLGFAGDWATNGVPYARGFNLGGTLQLPNQAQVHGTVGTQLPGAYCTVSCTRGGPALVDPPHSTAVLDFTGNPRNSVVPHISVEWDRADEGRSHALGVQGDAVWRIRSNFDVSLAAFASNWHYGSHYYGRFGDALSDSAHYTVAQLEQPTRSLTARTNYTITRTLTVQWYGQAYISRGAFSNVSEIIDPRAKDWASRFRPYPDPVVTSSPGGIDYKQFRSNTVLRWEYRPGSTLFVVWSQQRTVDGGASSIPGLWPGQDFRDLFRLRPDNTIAVKASYWFSR